MTSDYSSLERHVPEDEPLPLSRCPGVVVVGLVVIVFAVVLAAVAIFWWLA